jgi:hypothetical protein
MVQPLANSAGLRSLARQKEVTLMKRIILLVTVALVMALMMALAGPALATIHPLANMECSNDAHASAVTQIQDPPGLSGQSNTDNIAQPIISVVTAQGPNSPAFKTFPSEDAPTQEYCPPEN